MKWPFRFKKTLARHPIYRGLIARPWRAWRWLAIERPMRFTRFGIFYVLFTLAVGAAAINTGNNLLYLILGIQLSFIIVSGILSDSVLWGLRSRWRPVGDLFAQRAAHWTLEVHKGWFPSALVKFSGEWSAGVTQSVWLPWVASGQAATTTFMLTPPARGWLQLKRVRYSTAFPFGLFEKTHGQMRHERWLVFPPLKPIAWDSLWASISAASHTSTVRRAGEGSVPWQVRAYRPGDSLRHMDWKTVAKRGDYFVKETEDDAAPAPILVVRAWPRAECEEFISFVASLLWSAAQRGQPLGFYAPDHYFAGGTSADLMRPTWRYLALVDPEHPGRREPMPAARVTMDAIELWRAHRHEFRA